MITPEMREYGFAGAAPVPTGADLIKAAIAFLALHIKTPIWPESDTGTSIRKRVISPGTRSKSVPPNRSPQSSVID